MKIRHPVLLSSFGLTLAWLVRSWMATMRFRNYSLDPTFGPRDLEHMPPRIWTFWHENLLLPLYYYGQRGMKVLISQHADGTFITGVCRQMGLGVVRGSSTRGGTEALQELIRVARRSHLAITPDGPRGPRRRVQAGVVYLASRTGLPIVPLGFGYQKAWRLHSWDRFAVPTFASLGTCVAGAPVQVPAGANRRVLEEYRTRVEERLLQVTELAETWATTERLPKSATPGLSPIASVA